MPPPWPCFFKPATACPGLLNHLAQRALRKPPHKTRGPLRQTMCSGPWNSCPGSPNWPMNQPASSTLGSWSNCTKPIAVLPVKTFPWFDRERLWFEFHRAGFTLADLVRVVRYLQKEIRHTSPQRRCAQAINLLQLDRFEEDLNISRVRLTVEPPRPKAPASPAPACSPDEQERGRQHALETVAQPQR